MEPVWCPAWVFSLGLWSFGDFLVELVEMLVVLSGAMASCLRPNSFHVVKVWGSQCEIKESQASSSVSSALPFSRQGNQTEAIGSACGSLMNCINIPHLHLGGDGEWPIQVTTSGLCPSSRVLLTSLTLFSEADPQGRKRPYCSAFVWSFNVVINSSRVGPPHLQFVPAVSTNRKSKIFLKNCQLYLFIIP